MTARDIYDAVGVELNKVKAPSILLEDFNYLLNKSIIQVTNKFYNSYDISQQTTDDIRVLKATATLTPKKIGESGTLDLYGAAYEAYLPSDYYHILNAICKFIPQVDYKSYKKNVPLYVGARRLVADSWPVLVNNLYNRPSYKMPYYFINNINTQDLEPTNPYTAYNSTTNPQALGSGTDFNGTYNVTDPNDIRNLSSDMPVGDGSKTIGLANSEKIAGYRYGNASSVRMELRYGKDSSTFVLDKIYVDYIKSPQYIALTEEQIDTTLDKSQMMEFPDYVNYEIISNLVGLILENTTNPRENTFIPLQQTIAPAQAQIQMQQAKEQIKNM